MPRHLTASGWPGWRKLCPGAGLAPEGVRSTGPHEAQGSPSGARGVRGRLDHRAAGARSRAASARGSLKELTPPRLGLHCRKSKERKFRPRGQHGQWQRGAETPGRGLYGETEPAQRSGEAPGQGDDCPTVQMAPGATGASECRARLGVGGGSLWGGGRLFPLPSDTVKHSLKRVLLSITSTCLSAPYRVAGTKYTVDHQILFL